MFMKLIRTTKSDEVVLGKGFVPMLATFFAGEEEEFAQFSNLKESGKQIHIIIDPTGTVTLKGEEKQSFKESLTGELMPEPLPAEGPRPGESAPGRVSARGPRWRTVYQLAVGSLLVTVALGLFALLISDHAPWRETKGDGIGTVIGENLSVPAEQNQGLVPVPSASAKRARPQGLVRQQGARPQGQRLTYKQGKPPQPLAYDQVKSPQSLAPYRLNDAELDALVLKQDAAWRVSQR